MARRPDQLSDEEKTWLCEIGSGCFRDPADKDYIAARMCLRVGLIEPFLWIGMQCLEKYCKAILTFNYLSTKGLGHDLELAIKKCEELDFVDFDFGSREKVVVRTLHECGQSRYLERHVSTHYLTFTRFDSIVWKIRRYCEPVDYEMGRRDDRYNVKPYKVARMKSETYEKKPHLYRIHGGYLEKLVDSRKTSFPSTWKQREPLVWKNFYFGKRKKNFVTHVTDHGVGINPPHYMNKQTYLMAKEFIRLPKDVREYLDQKWGL